MKKVVQNLLRKVGLYQRIKSSCAYDVYWRLANPKLLQERDAEVAFYRALLTELKPNDLIFDVGANKGHKTDVFLRLGARVIAVDPDPVNQDTLRQSFHALRWRKPPVQIVGKAISDRIGTEIFWVETPGSAKNTLNRKWVDTLRTDASRFGEQLKFQTKREVQTTTLTEMIAEHGRPFFIKIDVEGHETAVLKGMNAPVPFLSFEVNLPEFQPEAFESVDILRRLDPDGRFNFTSDCRAPFPPDSWLTPEALRRKVEDCREPCIEVFWASAGTRDRG